MKVIIISFLLASGILVARAQEGQTTTKTGSGDHNRKAPVADSVKLKIDSTMAYYQNTVAVDSDIKISTIYTRVLECMAAKNFTQTYGYEQEGKLIFTTTQDLNANAVFGGDNDDPNPYTVQFAITIDMKNCSYRYTIDNIIFYLPALNGNRRMALYDLYEMETGNESRRTQKNARTIVDSFERYLETLTSQLYTEIEHKAAIYNSKF
jgi:hypothetical protein